MRPLRIVLAHNAYQQRGGEDGVVDAEIELLRARGHEVIAYQRHNDDLQRMPKLDAAASTLWSRRTSTELSELIARGRPDLIHVHNTFPLISPSIYWAAAAARVPVVQTLHNFRLHCPQAMYLCAGQVCEDCLGRLPWRAVARRCYRESRAQSAVLGGMLVVHRVLGTYRDKVTRYIALSDFSRRKFIAGGLPASRIAVKPNFVDFPPPPTGARLGFLFVGRLSPEKGVAVLLRAWASLAAGAGAGAALRVAGSGPEAGRLAGVAGVAALGALSAESVRAQMASALALVLPSICYENFPRVLVEAFACRLPVIASRLGALADLVDDGVTGLLFAPGDAADLARKLRWAQAHPERMAEMGRNARVKYAAEFSAERNHGQLMAIYTDAIDAFATERN